MHADASAQQMSCHKDRDVGERSESCCNPPDSERVLAGKPGYFLPLGNMCLQRVLTHRRGLGPTRQPDRSTRLLSGMKDLVSPVRRPRLWAWRLVPPAGTCATGSTRSAGRPVRDHAPRAWIKRETRPGTTPTQGRRLLLPHHRPAAATAMATATGAAVTGRSAVTGAAEPRSRTPSLCAR